MISNKTILCHSCGELSVDIFYEVLNVPTNSVLLLNTKKQAVDFPRGDIKLGFCQTCGHIFNTAFDPVLTEYSGRYESTQGLSPTFNRFNQKLAQDLIERFNLYDKSIIEIGCGNGEFLTLLCEMGHNRGLGFDPAHQDGRVPSNPDTEITYLTEFYSEAYADRQADFIVCKMTLEHIIDTARFVGMIRQAIGSNLNTTVFFQIPNGRYVFGELAFWDIYYEHCSYFSQDSLARLFRQENFDLLDIWTDYDDQYLMIAAQPGMKEKTPQLEKEDLPVVAAEVARFTRKIPTQLDHWQGLIRKNHAQGKKIILWGGGSKGVAFLTTLGITQEIQFAVDLNPHKAHTFFAGTGQEIIPPSDLTSIKPDLIIIMNPVYTAEITADLHAMNLYPEILALGPFEHQLSS